MAAYPLNVEYDEANDVLHVNGMKYSGCLFRMFMLAQPGTWVRVIERSDDGVLSVFRPADDVERTFDAVLGFSPGAQLRQAPRL